MGDKQGDKIEHEQEETGGNKKQGINGVHKEKEDVSKDGCAEDNEGDPARCARGIQVTVAVPLFVDLCPEGLVQRRNGP